MEIDIILLGILSGGDFFGYELMKVIKSVMTDIADVTTGTLYYKLKGLEKKGFLTSAREREGRRPPRRRYTITGDGRRELWRLAKSSIETGKRPYWSYLPGLFFVQYLPVAETAAAIRQRAARLARTQRRLEVTRDRMSSGGGYPFHAGLLVEHGLRHLEVDIEWLEKFARSLERNGHTLGDFLYGRQAWDEFMENMPLHNGEGECC